MNPVQRVTPGRKRRRRSHHSLKAKPSAMCPLSGMPKMHHRACKQSGFVRPGLVISVPKLGIGPNRD